MIISITGKPKEIAALAAVMQEQRNTSGETHKVKFVPETADGSCPSDKMVTAYSEGNRRQTSPDARSYPPPAP